ncbi:ABC transporter ATP-binding protein [Oricola thermophila]|uniref:ABC transporter ATP-binding protein n=1 Tax=Oricola thermophila TaxID=2742145 RepID=A0A6N1VIS5_9HYPH|nr:ABC transporter ATP-binding protein [Oricola thermophila]QKV20698.1 ABC transporter ATP-binding protein [Oricola thermophila]
MAGNVFSLLRRVVAENGRDYVGAYAVAAGCLVLVAITTAFSAWILRDVINEIFYNRREDLIVWICAAVLVAFLVRGLATYGQAVILARVGNDIVARYQKRVFAKLMALGVDFFADSRSGELAARINQNITAIRDVLNLTVTSLARDLLSLVGLVGVMVTQDWVLSLASLLIGPPMVLAVAYVSRRIRGVVRDTVLLNAHVIGSMQEVAQGITVVKAFTMEEQLTARVGRLIEQARERADRLAGISERVTPMSDILAGIVIAGVIAYGGYRAIVVDEPPGSTLAFIAALMLAYEPAKRLARLQVNMERAMVNARMIYELIDMEVRQEDVAGAASLAVSDGRIVFDRVGFAYPAGGPVLHDLSFVAEAGKTTAIVGASGAGKSTVIALLQRFYDPQSGTISIDGQDIGSVTMASLRGAIAYVSQQPYLFEGTIRDNIRYGREDATDAEIEEAARLANAEEFILSQPQGYDTPVGENGVTLSGGQRQRLSIARAFVRNAPILLLDEATSALDNESEKLVQDALDKAMRGRTTIVIAHRLSTVVGADKIVVMEAGRVVEEGNHASLIGKPDGVYARFYRLQGESAPNLLEAPRPGETQAKQTG